MRVPWWSRGQVNESVGSVPRIILGGSRGRQIPFATDIGRAGVASWVLLAAIFGWSVAYGAGPQLEIMGDGMKVTWLNEELVSASHRTLPPNTIAGVVETPDGKPIEGADLYLFRVQLRTDERKLLQHLRSPANGAYRFEKVIATGGAGTDFKPTPPAPVQADQLEVVVRGSGYATLAWFFDPQKVVQSGQRWDWELPPAARLSGRVTAPDDKPVVNARVRVRNAPFSSNWNAVNSCRTDIDGRYVIDDLLPFELRKDGRQKSELINPSWSSSAVTRPLFWVEHSRFAGILLSADAVPGSKDVQLAVPAACTGQVRYFATDEPASDILVVAATAIPGPMQATVADAFRSPMFHRSEARTDKLGYYRFMNLPAGIYDLWAESTGWWCSGIPSVPLHAAQTRTVSPLLLAKGGVARVRLINAHNQETIRPSPDVKFTILPVYSPMRYRALADMLWTAANAEGRLELHLPAGKLLLPVNIEPTGKQSWKLPHVPTVELMEGEAKDIDIPLVPLDRTTAEPVLPMYRDEQQRLLLESIEVHSAQLRKEPTDFESLAGRAAGYAALRDLPHAKADRAVPAVKSGRLLGRAGP